MVLVAAAALLQYAAALDCNCSAPPAHLRRPAAATYTLTRDAHASSLNAVLPAYDRPGDEGPRDGARSHNCHPIWSKHPQRFICVGA